MPPLLSALFLMIAVAATMLACGPAAQPMPADDGALPAAQQVGGGSKTPAAEPAKTPTLGPSAGDYTKSPEKSGTNPDPYADMPPPPTLKYPNLHRNLDKLAIEAAAAQAVGSHSCAGPASPGVPVRIWMSTNPEDAKTRSLVKWLETQGIPPGSVSVSALSEVYGYGSTIWLASLPTRLLWPVAQREGVTLVDDAGGEIISAPDLPGRSGPKYPVLENFSRYAEEAEEAQANAAPGQSKAKVRKVFVLISLYSGDSGKPMLAWLQSNGVPEIDDWRYGVENHLVAVYGICFSAGSGPAPGYIYAIVPASLLLPLMQQPDFARIEDACNTFPCFPLYSRKYPLTSSVSV